MPSKKALRAAGVEAEGEDVEDNAAQDDEAAARKAKKKQRLEVEENPGEDDDTAARKAKKKKERLEDEETTAAAPEADEEETRRRKGEKRLRKEEAVVEDEDDDDACMKAAIARHKKLLNKCGDAGASEDASAPESAKLRKKLLQNEKASDAAVPGVAAETPSRDWSGVIAAKREEKAKKKEKSQKEVDEAAAEAKRQDLAERAAKNALIRKKGKMTKKDKYKAAKEAKKAESINQQGESKIPSKALEAEALAAAGMEKLDPKAVDCFLTGLPYMATEWHVEQHFAKVGPCSVQIMRDQATGKATGKGFVTFPTAEQALKASTFSGTKIQNRWIQVRLCEVRDTGRSRSSLGPGEKPEGCLSAVVMCDKSTSEASLWKFFQDCKVSSVSQMMDTSTGEFRGMAFLDFENTEHVDLAVAKNGSSLKGRPVFVRYKSDKPGVNAAGGGGGGGGRGGGGGGGRGEEDRPGRIAAHNRAPPMPPPSGKATKFDESDDDEE